MEENTAVTVVNNYQVVNTPEQIRANVNLIQNVMAKVMKRGVHFDTIPGCGDKPTLLKPGAEKLCSTFLLAPDPIIEDLSTKDERRYRIKCRLIHSPSGTFMGSGVGECSSEEEKYKWRNAVSDREYEATPEERRRVKYSKYGDKKQVRTNIADVSNTVLKMAKKRSLVDGTLTVTGASDMFGQDLEDEDVEIPIKHTPSMPHTAPFTASPEELADLEAKKEAAKRKLAEMEAKEPKPAKDSTEGPKTAPTKPQALPDGHMQVTGIVVSRGEPNRGGYVKYNLEGVKDDLGYDIGFSTCDPTIIETLNTRLENMAPACIEYTVSHTGRYTNYNIIGLIAVE